MNDSEMPLKWKLFIAALAGAGGALLICLLTHHLNRIAKARLKP